MKKNLLFVNQSQFGYHIDYVQYCRYLKNDYNIKYLCWDFDKVKIDEPGISIQYVSRAGNIVKRNIKFIRSILKCTKQQNFDLAFIHYFRGCSFLPFFLTDKQVIHLDIRTGNVSPNMIKRNFYNTILRFESKFFKSQSIISVGLRNLLRISRSAHILPLGANPILVNREVTCQMHLLYIGTLSSRRIEDTIDGINIFLKNNPNADIYYSIVGDGWHNEMQELQNRINALGLEEYIELAGYVPYNELFQFYQKTNVGVSYVPITSYYEFQPATKTFEYLMAGMPVIATSTYENRQVINQINGVLIQDTPESFACGIASIYENIFSFDENLIIKTVENYEWSRIVQTMKKTILHFSEI